MWHYFTTMLAPDLRPAPYAEADISLLPATITRAGLLSPLEIADQVRRWGIVVFPGLFQGDRLARLNAEFDLMMGLRDRLGFPVDAYDNMVNIRIVRDRLPADAFPMTQGTFADPFMGETADAYFGVGQYRLNGEIFVTSLAETLRPQNAPPFALHFDKRQVLKFFIYLTDTDEGNGAMRVLPGSNLRNRRDRERAMRETTISDIANVLPEPQTPSVPICGPAGTMFVFDTDVCHGASVVGPGKMRRTMRGHTHAHSMLRAMGVH
jgi:hypothetical protein